MGPDDLRDDRQPEAAPAVVAAPGLVEPHEALEDPRPLVLRYAGPVVLDDHLDRARALSRTETAIRERACRAALSTRLRTTWPSAGSSPRTRPGADPDDVDVETVAPHPARLGEDEVVEVDVAG